jgi:hypothetical protein
VPVVTDVEVARRLPELAVMSAVAHGGRSESTAIFEALLAGPNEVDLGKAALYTDLVLAALPEAARDRLEGLMAIANYQYQSEFALRYVRQGEAKGRAEGQAMGEAEALLTILDARGIAVPDDVRQRITDCTDLDQLTAWIRRAATAGKIEDLAF